MIHFQPVNYSFLLLPKLSYCPTPIQPDEEASIQSLLSRVQVLNITDSIKAEAITLRKMHRLKIPDAMVAATAIVIGSVLVSNDEKLVKASGIQCLSLRTE